MGYPHIVKKCGDCEAVKPVDEFYANKRGNRYRDGYCKDCRRTRDRARQVGRNKIVARLMQKDPLYFRRKKLKKIYGITVEQFEAMRVAQGGVCAICNEPERRMMYGRLAYLSVDHDHATGKVRALLCHACNVAIAPIEDEPFRTKALAYLRRFS